MKNWKNKSYIEYVNFLLSKYGKVDGDYFTDENYKINQKIKRGKEGLFIHHIDEDKAIMLSNIEHVTLFNMPFDFQKANRLVYCDLLEHMILHILIVKEDKESIGIKRYISNQIPGEGGIINFILPELLDIYSGIKYKAPWKQKVVENVIDRKEEFIDAISFFSKLGFSEEKIFKYRSYIHNRFIWNEGMNEKLINEISSRIKN